MITQILQSLQPSAFTDLVSDSLPIPAMNRWAIFNRPLTRTLRNATFCAKRPTIVIFVGTTQSTTACRMAVGHTRIAACGWFESDGPNHVDVEPTIVVIVGL